MRDEWADERNHIKELELRLNKVGFKDFDTTYTVEHRSSRRLVEPMLCRIEELEAKLKTMIEPEFVQGLVHAAEPMLSEALVASEMRVKELEAEVKAVTAHSVKLADELATSRSHHADESSAHDETSAKLAKAVVAIDYAHDTLIEINPSNYAHDDVCELNDRSVEVILYLASTIADLKGGDA